MGGRVGLLDGQKEPTDDVFRRVCEWDHAFMFDGFTYPWKRTTSIICISNSLITRRALDRCRLQQTGEHHHERSVQHILTLGCIEVSSISMLYLLSFPIELMPKASPSWVLGSLPTPKDRAFSYVDPGAWLSGRRFSCELENGVVPGGCLWESCWLYCMVAEA